MILPALATIFGLMAAELGLSRRNERRLRALGALEPPNDVYPWLRVVYPAAFLAMGIEGLVRGGSSVAQGRDHWSGTLTAGLVVFVASKALKAWAIASLGGNWSFRVLVPPRRALVSSGPYRYLSHPNYLAIGGELVGTALAVGAPVTGIVSLAAVGALLARRIEVEERALGLRT